MNDFKVISADSHVFEPPDLWTSRIDAEFRDMAPHVIKGEEYDIWRMFEGGVGVSFGQATQTGLRFTDPGAITLRAKAEDVPAGTYEPSQHIKDLASDGVDAEVVFPTVALGVFRIKNDRYLSAIFRAYNDWVAEFCSVYPHQTKGIALINVDDVEEAVQEMYRCRKMGLVGAMISTDPNPDPNDHRVYQLPKYEPLWAAADDLQMSLNMHVGTPRYDRDLMWDTNGTHDYVSNVDHMVWICKEAQQDSWVRRAVTSMIFSGVFERHPGVQVGIVEHEMSWIPHFLVRMDYIYKERTMHVEHRFKDGILPSDVFHSNVFVSFQEDGLGVRARDLIGVDNMLWGNDYPHSESTFPRSRQIIDEIFVGVPDDERYKIVCANAMRLYHFDSN